MSTYEQFQSERYGNILPGSANEADELENGELIMQEQLVWFEKEEQVANDEIYL